MTNVTSSQHQLRDKVKTCLSPTPRAIYHKRRVHLELLPILAAQLQRHLKAQAKPLRGVMPQPETAAAAAIECARAAQQRLPRSHPLAAPLAGACAAAAAKGGGQPDVIAVLEGIAALLPSPGLSLWPQVCDESPKCQTCSGDCDELL